MSTPRPADRRRGTGAFADADLQARLTPMQFDVTQQPGHRAGLHRRVLGLPRRRHLPLRRLRRAAVLVRDQVRVGHRLAQLLPARARGRRRDPQRHQPRHGPRRGRVRQLRRPPRPRVPRRAPAHGRALLHELGVAAPRPRGRRRRRRRPDRRVRRRCPDRAERRRDRRRERQLPHDLVAGAPVDRAPSAPAPSRSPGTGPRRRGPASRQAPRSRSGPGSGGRGTGGDRRGWPIVAVAPATTAASASRPVDRAGRSPRDPAVDTRGPSSAHTGAGAASAGTAPSSASDGGVDRRPRRGTAGSRATARAAPSARRARPAGAARRAGRARPPAAAPRRTAAARDRSARSRVAATWSRWRSRFSTEMVANWRTRSRSPGSRTRHGGGLAADARGQPHGADGLALLLAGPGHARSTATDDVGTQHPAGARRHGAGRLLGDDRPRRHAEHVELHLAGVGHDAAAEHVARAGHGGQPRGDQPAGQRLGRGQGEALRPGTGRARPTSIVSSSVLKMRSPSSPRSTATSSVEDGLGLLGGRRLGREPQLQPLDAAGQPGQRAVPGLPPARRGTGPATSARPDSVWPQVRSVRLRITAVSPARRAGRG